MQGGQVMFVLYDNSEILSPDKNSFKVGIYSSIETSTVVGPSQLLDYDSKLVIYRNRNFQLRPKPNIRHHCRYQIFGFGRIFGVLCRTPLNTNILQK
jgi:hypothetical protein